MHSAFMTCKNRVALGESLNQNLEELITATEKIWKRIQAKTVTIKNTKMLLNGDVRKLFSADDITAAEKPS